MKHKLGSAHFQKILAYRCFFKFFFNVYLFLRERERQTASRGGAERETKNPKQGPDSELSAQSPTQGLNSQIMRS